MQFAFCALVQQKKYVSAFVCFLQNTQSCKRTPAARRIKRAVDNDAGTRADPVESLSEWAILIGEQTIIPVCQIFVIIKCAHWRASEARFRVVVPPRASLLFGAFNAPSRFSGAAGKRFHWRR